MTKRVRIDRLLVERGLFESRAKAQAGDRRRHGDGRRCHRQQAGRRGVRRRRVAGGAGASLGVARRREACGGARSFRDRPGRSHLPRRRRLDRRLHAGAARARRPAVYAVDVGRGQLHASLREHRDVVAIEATDIRKLEPARLEAPPDLVTVDVSFIPLKLVLPAALALARPAAEAVVLIKPQYEAGPDHVKKGVVRDPADPCAGLRRRDGPRHVAGLDRPRRHPVPDCGRRRQSRIPDCRPARL